MVARKKDTGTSLRIVSSCVTHACNALMIYQQIACRNCPLCGTSFVGPRGGPSPYETVLSSPRAYQLLLKFNMALVEDRKAAQNQLVSLTAVFWMSRNASPRETNNQPDPLPL